MADKKHPQDPTEEQKRKAEAAAKADAERQELLQRAAQNTGRQLRLDVNTGKLGEFEELRETLGKSFEDPAQKYDVYYKGIRRILMRYLPKGKDFEKARRIIYDEKNVFLNLGRKKSEGKNGARGSDGRMTYQPVMNEMLDLIVKWVSESQDPIALYKLLYALNEQHGYGHEIYDGTTQHFANAMRKLAADESING